MNMMNPSHRNGNWQMTQQKKVQQVAISVCIMAARVDINN